MSKSAMKMKNVRTIGLVLGLACGAAVVLAGTSVLAGRYLTGQGEEKPAAEIACHAGHSEHVVIIQNDKVTPERTQAARCDSLTIINRDARQREIGFGEHDHHQAYDGVSEKLLGEDQSFTVVLRQTGTYRFHDHFHDEVVGYFTVSK
jgi:plastocyanin